MSNTPILDGRTLRDLNGQFEKRAMEFTPEWKFDRENTDAGVTLAQLFTEMHYETVDRFNQLPEKYYVELLNLLGVKENNVTPATGYVRFDASDALEQSVDIPEGTTVFAKREDGENTVFQTARRIAASPARLAGLFYANSDKGVIEKLDIGKTNAFFTENGGENIQRHSFSISNNDVLNIDFPAEIELELIQKAHFQEADTASLLADEECAKYFYLTGGKLKPFDKASADGNHVKLTKNNFDTLQPDENGNICVYCDVDGAVKDTIVLDAVNIQSRPISPKQNNIAVAGNTIPIDLRDGGYCFGRRPMEYDCFYMRSDSIFDKRGAVISVELDISTVTHDDIDENEVVLTYGKSIIDKNDAVKIELDNVYVEEVIFEYFNNTDWTKLEVWDDRNPFACREDGKKRFVFRCPNDMTPAVVNGEEGCCIRARVVHVANFLSSKGRWLLPFVKSAKGAYQYDTPRSAARLTSVNNAARRSVENAAEVASLEFTIYEPQPQTPPAMYLMFDRSPDGWPFSLFFGLNAKDMSAGTVAIEYFDGKSFEQVRFIDDTSYFANTGNILLYFSEKLAETELFGERGCFVRFVLTEPTGMFPQVSRIATNAVRAIQASRANDQYFSTEVYEANKELELIYSPVVICEVWVDEKNRCTNAEIEQMEREQPLDIKVERDEGEIKSCLVRYRRISELRRAAPNDRCYELNAFEGKIRFGDGIHGYVPPYGGDNILVRYAYGGGAAGNMPEGSIHDMQNSVAYITDVENITRMNGGTERMPFEKQKLLGNKFLRHRRRAVAAEEYEQIVLDAFPQIEQARCFANTDENGRHNIGHVSVVLMCGRDSADKMDDDLSGDIYDYLKTRCECSLIAEKKLHVLKSIDVVVNTTVCAELKHPELIVVTQNRLKKAINDVIENVWAKRRVGEQFSLKELMKAASETPNIAFVREMLIEGVYFNKGVRTIIPIETDTSLKFATVSSGKHTFKLI